MINAPIQVALRLVALAALAAVFLAACATTTGGGGGGDVVKRAEARWEAVLAGDYETAYIYHTPGYRSSHSRGDYELSMRLRKVQYKDARYLEQSCEGDRCVLKFEVNYQIASPVPGLDKWESTSIIDETWVRTENEWWHLPDDS